MFKRRVLLSAILAMITSQAGATSPQRFDLVCSGNETSDASGTKPFSIELSIDLNDRTWCFVSCKAINSFVEVTPGTLIFIKQESKTGSVETYDGMSVNRASGYYIEVHRADSPITAGYKTGREGNCIPAAFQPRPATKF